jgi:hypothetical protein
VGNFSQIPMQSGLNSKENLKKFDVPMSNHCCAGVVLAKNQVFKETKFTKFTMHVKKGLKSF